MNWILKGDYVLYQREDIGKDENKIIEYLCGWYASHYYLLVQVIIKHNYGMWLCILCSSHTYSMPKIL